MAERAVGYVGDVELPGGVDEAVGFVEGFEGGVFGLDGVDPGYYTMGSGKTGLLIIFMLVASALAQDPMVWIVLW